jgi:hypothetical protein
MMPDIVDQYRPDPVDFDWVEDDVLRFNAPGGKVKDYNISLVDPELVKFGLSRPGLKIEECKSSLPSRIGRRREPYSEKDQEWFVEFNSINIPLPDADKKIEPVMRKNHVFYADAAGNVIKLNLRDFTKIKMGANLGPLSEISFNWSQLLGYDSDSKKLMVADLTYKSRLREDIHKLFFILNINLSPALASIVVDYVYEEEEDFGWPRRLPPRSLNLLNSFPRWSKKLDALYYSLITAADGMPALQFAALDFFVRSLQRPGSDVDKCIAATEKGYPSLFRSFWSTSTPVQKLFTGISNRSWRYQ